MQRCIRFAAIALACALAAPLTAQELAQVASPGLARPLAAAPVAEPAAAAAAAPSLSPTVGHAAVGARRAVGSPEPATAPKRADSTRNRALMIVGGAALIVGAVISGTPGTIIMVAGGIMGLYGLFQYLQ